MRSYGQRRQDPVPKIEGTKTFSLGLSQLGHPSVIKSNELAEALNAFYTQNGIVEKRPGSKVIGAIRGSSTDINAMQGVYAVGGNDYFLRISDDGIMQRYVWNQDLWVDISGSPTFQDTEATILQSWGNVYILSSLDPMTKWDGTTFTTFTAVNNPSTAPVLAKSGSATGTNQYYYRYVWQTAAGNTLASSNAFINSLPEKLDASTYVSVTMPSAPANVIKTMIFRGKTSGDEVYLASVDASQTVYNDKGFDSEDPLYGIPATNTTGGMHFKFATVYNDTLVGVTTELGDHCIVFSAGGDKFDSFGRADGAGYFYWKKDDGSRITGLHEFQEELYIFKSNKIGAFKFTTTGAQVRTISLASGAVSHRSIHAAGNDLRYWSIDGAMSVGNEPNFANVVRTKVLSARADKIVQAINQSDISKIAGVYYKNHSLWGLPQGTTGSGNSTVLAYNERFAAWSEWFGLKPKMWAKVIDPDNKERLFFADSTSANVVEAWTGTDDAGAAIVWRISTKQFDANVAYKFKTYNRVFFVFGNVKGGNTRVVLTENGYKPQLPLALYASNTGDQGFGVDQWGTVEFGDSSGEFSGDASGINIRYANVGYKDLFSLQATFTNDGMSDQVQLMGMYIEYSDSSLPLPSTYELKPVYA